MGKDDASVPGLEAQARKDQAAAKRYALTLELLVVEVERGLLVSEERAVLAPMLERFGGPLVAVAVAVVSKLDMDGVVGRALVESALLFGRDDVEGRADGFREVEAGRVAEGAKGADVGHGVEDSTGRLRAASGAAIEWHRHDGDGADGSLERAAKAIKNAAMGAIIPLAYRGMFWISLVVESPTARTILPAVWFALGMLLTLAVGIRERAVGWIGPRRMSRAMGLFLWLIGPLTF